MTPVRKFHCCTYYFGFGFGSTFYSCMLYSIACMKCMMYNCRDSACMWANTCHSALTTCHAPLSHHLRSSLSEKNFPLSSVPTGNVARNTAVSAPSAAVRGGRLWPAISVLHQPGHIALISTPFAPGLLVSLPKSRAWIRVSAETATLLTP